MVPSSCLHCYTQAYQIQIAKTWHESIPMLKLHNKMGSRHASTAVSNFQFPSILYPLSLFKHSRHASEQHSKEGHEQEQHSMRHPLRDLPPLPRMAQQAAAPLHEWYSRQRHIIAQVPPRPPSLTSLPPPPPCDANHGGRCRARGVVGIGPSLRPRPLDLHPRHAKNDAECGAGADPASRHHRRPSTLTLDPLRALKNWMETTGEEAHLA